MKIKITTKGFRIPTELYKHLGFHLQKISKRLPNITEDLSPLNLIIRKITHKHHLKRHHHKFTNYSDRKSVSVSFEGSLKLPLPKKPLFIKFYGQTINQGIDQAIDRLKKELQKYKALHFKSQSEYPNHQTIRFPPSCWNHK